MPGGGILHKKADTRSRMIPDCNDDGYLPTGIHPATLDQIAARFGRESELRLNMELVDPRAFQQFTERTFATDRNLVPKGMLEVVP
jgi:hypothetical protein